MRRDHRRGLGQPIALEDLAAELALERLDDLDREGSRARSPHPHARGVEPRRLRVVQEVDEHRGHRGHRDRLEFLDGLEHRLRMEPAEQDGPRAQDVPRVHHGETVGVGEREHPDPPVLAPKLVQRGGRARIGFEIAVRERDALGHPGGPGSVEDDGQIIGTPIDRGEGVWLPRRFLGHRASASVPGSVDQQHVAERGQDPDLPLHLPEHVGGGDDHLRLGVGQDVGHFLVAQQEDHRYDHAAALENGAVALHHLRAVGEHHHHTVAGSDP